MLTRQSISSPSKSVILIAPPDIIFLMIKGPDHLGFIFSLGSKVSSLSTFRTKFPSLKFLRFTFLLNALAILFWYPCTWYYASALFSSIKTNCSYLALAQSSSRTLVSTKLSRIVSPPQWKALPHYHKPKSKVLSQSMHG